jgi:SPRY domain-containing SOCS box protein 1/4
VRSSSVKGDVNSNSRLSLNDYRHGRSNGSPKVITDVRLLPELPKPARLDLLLSMPPVNREEQLEHSWNPNDRSFNIYVMVSNKLRLAISKE